MKKNHIKNKLLTTPINEIDNYEDYNKKLVDNGYDKLEFLLRSDNVNDGKHDIYRFGKRSLHN